MILERQRVLAPVLTGSLVLLALCGCSNDGAVVDARPLPTSASGDLICGMLPKASVQALLGDTEYAVSGPGPHLARGIINFASCKLQKPKDPSEDYVFAYMTLGKDGNISDDPRVKMAGAAVADLGVGFVDVDSKREAWAGVARGNRTYHVSVKESSDVRDPAADAQALLRQVIGILDEKK